MTMLAVDDIHVYYGNIAALKGLSFKVEQGEIVTLLGSNGAGKSTTLRTISGLLRPRLGSLAFEGKRLDGVQAHDVVGTADEALLRPLLETAARQPGE